MTKKIFIPKDRNLLDPKEDSIFKTIFTQSGQGTKLALKNLVMAIIGHEPEDVEIINNELPKTVEKAKDIRLDLQCRMKDGDLVNIEIQTCKDNDSLTKRSIYYASRMMSSVELKGDRYEKLPSVYHVMFANFRLFDEDNDYMHRLIIRDEKVKIEDTFIFVFIQMPLLRIGDRDVKNLSDIEKWVIFLRESTDRNKRDLLNEIMSSNEGIREAGEILMEISEELREWSRKEMRYKAEVDKLAALATAREDGRTEGKLEVARGMKTEGIPIETIIKITGLTDEQIEAL
ncbi:MAG: Rpn family recombination-promoting nuclease/putative transposase [Spirochaetia bacterium]|nr:Rpn family recombination-promoting nuclease/putative transposase [Spirochaetia bacterium]MBR4796175.1 Rpn family recombination-promoting nuclease/putative transposase [Spirochaetia bacterium]MBR5017466.1 Rpn family recombination-promoting nuclease/putative transposase [Spirochaetia bacterium]